MQISAANLLATQSQTTVRARGAAAAFEPIAFKEATVAAEAPSATSTAAPSAPSPAAAVTTGPTGANYGGYVRPGTHLDIKI